MFSPFERMVAFRYLRAKRKEGFISVISGFSLLGIMLGVATLIVVMAVMNGFRTELLGRILGINGHITIYSVTDRIDDYDQLAIRINQVPGILRVASTIEGQVMVTAHGAAQGAMVKGFEQKKLAEKKIISDHILVGNLKDFTGTDVVILGSQLAENLRVGIGDTITLISPQSNTTVLGAIPRHKDYRIIGLFNIGMYEYDSSTIFMPLEGAQIFFRYPRGVNSIEVMTTNADHAFETALSIADILGPKFNVVDWQQTNAHFFNALKVERRVMFLILTLIIIVAAFNIVSSLIMLVNDKGKDIAILRTMGATQGMILRIFFMTGASIGVMGTILGSILGISFAANIETIREWLETAIGHSIFDPVIYYLSELPAEIENSEVASVVIMSLILSFLATIYPAWKAARFNPAEALRYEK